MDGARALGAERLVAHLVGRGWSAEAIADAAGVDPAEYRRVVERAVRGLLNRLAMSNVEGIVASLANLAEGHPKRVVSDALVSAIIGALSPASRLQDAFLLTQAVLSAAASHVFGAEFAGRLVAGYDFVDDDDEPYDDTYIPNPLNPNSDIFSHGSMVAGIIGALTDNGAGVAGVAWKVKIMPIRVLGPSGSGDMTTLASAITWAVEHGAHIINLSLGGTESLSSVEDAIKNAVAHNVTVIAAAGNHFEGDESTGIKYPAKYDTCIAVGALGANRERASYSDYGQELDFVAPGGDGDNEYSYVASVGYNIKTKENIYVASTGTSLAAPHISGLAALLYAQGYTTPQRIYERLRAACLDLGSQGKDKYYGYGLPLATAALFDFTKFVVHLEAEDGTILSTPINAASNSTYSFRNLTPGPVRVCAWLDKNNNGQRDAGDLFGVINTTIRQNVMLEHNITVTTL